LIDAGQGDAILVEAGNASMLVDCGDAQHADAVVDYLNSSGITALNYLVATHPHADHIGGCPEVMRAVVVENVLDNGQNASSATYREFKAAAAGTNYSAAGKGFQSALGGAGFSVLWPVEKPLPGTNDNSIVIRLSFGSTAFMLMGDCERECEENLLNETIAAQVLKVGHHGSGTSTSQPFLDKVRPEAAIISVGANNTYGHPANATLSKLAAIGAAVYRTDLNGTITVSTNGTGYTVAAVGLPN